jgi:cell division protein FtsL
VKELRDYLLTGSYQTSEKVEEIKNSISKEKYSLDCYKKKIDIDACYRKIKDGKYLY